MKKILLFLVLLSAVSANAVSKKYACVTIFSQRQTCLRQEVKDFYDASPFGRTSQVVCTEYSPAVTIWTIFAVDKDGKQSIAGEFPDGPSAVKRLNQLIKANFCD